MTTKREETNAGTILIADDSADIRNTVSRFLRRKGYATLTARDGVEALGLIESAAIDLVLTDLRMPGLDGLAVLERIRASKPDLPVVILTAWPTVDATVRALRLGARDFLTKPVSINELIRVVENQMRLRRFWLKESTKDGQTERFVQRYLSQLKQGPAEDTDTLMPVLQTLANILDAREHETQAHSARVSAYAAYFAGRLGATADTVRTIRIGGLMHDIGKMGIPDSILLKPGKLNEDEWEVMKQHPQLGYDLLAGVSGLREAAEIVLAHHERWDGQGYPRALKGEEVPFGARVFGFVDTMDAMLSNRPYRLARTFGELHDEVKRCKGTQFDPEMVDAFLQIQEHEWKQAVEQHYPDLRQLTSIQGSVPPSNTAFMPVAASEVA